MTTRRIVTDFSKEGGSHADQLRSLANDILKHMRANANEPKVFKTYAESFAIVKKLLEDDLPTEKVQEANVDISAFKSDT